MMRIRKILSTLVILFGMTVIFTVSAHAIPPLQTGIDFCTDGSKRIDCPEPGEPFYGQDGNYQNGQARSYTKLDSQGNDLPDTATSWTMVRDNVTGLIWEVKTEENKDDTYTWPGSPYYVAQLNAQNFGGHSSWRLPEIKELFSLVNAGIAEPGPTIDTVYFPHTADAFYWSSFPLL